MNRKALLLATLLLPASLSSTAEAGEKVAVCHGVIDARMLGRTASNDDLIHGGWGVVFRLHIGGGIAWGSLSTSRQDLLAALLADLWRQMLERPGEIIVDDGLTWAGKATMSTSRRS